MQILAGIAGLTRWAVLLAFFVTVSGDRGLSASVRGPQYVPAGGEALLTCIVHGLGGGTVLWRRAGADGRHSPTRLRTAELLAAGRSRVTGDPRLQVLHGGSDVYVLVLRNVTVRDEGLYVCEVNSDPVARSFHRLHVISTSLAPPRVGPAPPASPRSEHAFGRCCHARNVSSSCLHLCTLEGLVAGGGPADVDACEADFARIVDCAADGRNHLPCCEDQGVPDMCTHICRGQHFLQKVTIRDYFSCHAFANDIINCISRGIETLPTSPDRLEVTARSLTSLRVSWISGRGGVIAPAADWFAVRVTRLRTFDGERLGLRKGNGSQVVTSQEVALTSQDVSLMSQEDASDDLTQLYNVSGSRRSLLVSGLRPLTMYQVSVTAYNDHGGSLPSDRVRAVTWLPESRAGVGAPPALPEVKQCCQEAGVREPRCLQKLCDPARTADIVVTDMIVCSPWTGATFSCLANGRDQGDCCRARGLPPACMPLCTGSVTQLDYRHFKCVHYMDSFASCLMQGYGVVPSAPLSPLVALTDSEFAVLRWDPPSTLADTVTSYTVRVRPAGADDAAYSSATGAHPPHLLDGLTPGSSYEFYVLANNEHGLGAESSRVLFQTLPAAVLAAEAEAQAGQVADLNGCCRRAGVSGTCLTLCDLGVNMTTVRRLTAVCLSELDKLVRCAAAGRDHVACCHRRGVPAACLGPCRGQAAPVSECAPYLGNTVQCFEEGAGTLPPPVIGLRASDVTDDAVTLVWEADGNGGQFQVRYGSINATTGLGGDVTKLDQVQTVTTGVARLTNLTKDQLYAFSVVAVNEHGSSLPVSVVTLNIGGGEVSGEVKAAISPPHSLSASDVTATEMTLTWVPPAIAPPDSRIRYRVSFRGENATEPENITTVSVSHRLLELVPNTAYSVVVTAVDAAGESEPSETLEAWTLPVYPAYVELPTIHPQDMVTEGGSMTVLCIAMGSPEPTVALYINGVLLNQNRTRHLVTSLTNVTRQMSHVTCYADNGYGTPIQTTRYIIISRPPIVTAERPDYNRSLGSSVTLRCRVDASPEPTLVFRRDSFVRSVIVNGGNYSISQRREAQEGHYTMELLIHRLTVSDFGGYSCHAENVLGKDAQTLTISQRQVPLRLYDLGVAECCRRLNVSQPCQRACAFDVDLDAVLGLPGCMQELGKLMTCAADGSDHRDCCSSRSVPDRCLDWCRGRPVPDDTSCTLGYVSDVVECFEQGKAVLPGPPYNVRVEAINSSDVRVLWNPPVKNTDKVELYRLTWRLQGQPTSGHVDTRSTWYRLSGLQPGSLYHVTVKAANHYGSSLQSRMLNFTAGLDEVSAPSPGGSELGSGTVLAVALVLLLLVLVALVLAGVWMVRRQRQNASSVDRLSFANPSYQRESRPVAENNGTDHLEITTSTTTNGVIGNAHDGVRDTSTSDGWRQAALQAPAAISLDQLRHGIGARSRENGFQRFENEQ
ncbi:Ig-like and fibronectin type-III domain-containing protein 1 isoform X2 [Pollicipes pollicipes]|uniref:Ig-like and fibronectin type-III domain-containing protein 1 isoform X2 n=1 Tax=Pollicipes pollicipes TaxID=41117 RepID=UPI001884C4E3|nr:Ig-like and fibronectin type-III domain-containing protein 1 isoform X2 [Pollicipes pollicipes]